MPHSGRCSPPRVWVTAIAQWSGSPCSIPSIIRARQRTRRLPLRAIRRGGRCLRRAAAPRARRHGIQKVERGGTYPYRDTVHRLVHALQLTPEDLVAFEAAARPTPRNRASGPSAAGLQELPAALTTFIGREREKDELVRLFADSAAAHVDRSRWLWQDAAGARSGEAGARELPGRRVGSSSSHPWPSRFSCRWRWPRHSGFATRPRRRLS
jgi:hypothetical protein